MWHNQKCYVKNILIYQRWKLFKTSLKQKKKYHNLKFYLLCIQLYKLKKKFTFSIFFFFFFFLTRTITKNQFTQELKSFNQPQENNKIFIFLLWSQRSSVSNSVRKHLL